MARIKFGGATEEGSLPPPDAGGIRVTESAGDESAKPRRGRPPGTRNKANMQEFESKLHDKLIEELFVPVAFVSPLAAANIEKRADRTAKAVTRMASRNPRVRKAIEKALDGSDVLTVVLFLVTTGVCAMVDFNMMPPDAMPSRIAGVPKLWEEIYPDTVMEEGVGYGADVTRGLMGRIKATEGMNGDGE